MKKVAFICVHNSCRSQVAENIYLGIFSVLYGVEFRVATSYTSTGVEYEHFVIEFLPIRLKYI